MTEPQEASTKALVDEPQIETGTTQKAMGINTTAEDLEDKHRIHEREYWRRQLRIGAWLNLLTVAAAIASLGGLFFLYQTLNIYRETLISGNRAWVAVKDVRIEGARDGNTPTFFVVYENLGREPAVSVSEHNYFHTVSSAALPALLKEIGSDKTGRDCLALDPQPGANIIYPSPNGPSVNFQIDTDSPLKGGVTQGATRIVISGCFAYETFGQTRHTSFCRIWRPIEGRQSGFLDGCFVGEHVD
jgi:hypothetical protein